MELLQDHKDAVEAHLQALGWLDAAEHISALESAGEGNMNRTLRVVTEKRTFIAKQSVPFVAKYPDIPAPVERLESERTFYEAIAGTPALAMRTPGILGYDASNNLLAMEDLGSTGDMTDAYARKPIGGLRDGQITALVYWLWKLHALPCENIELDNPDMRALNHAHIFDIPLQNDNGVALVAPIAEVAESLRADAAITAAAAQLGDIYLGKAPHGSRPALLHGDYYPGSWLKHPVHGIAVIDPEFAFVGPPEFDLGVMVAHLTFCHYDQAELTNVFRSYVTPPGFDYGLTMRFAAIEIIRRLLGVAQLPLHATTEQKIGWLNTARSLLSA